MHDLVIRNGLCFINGEFVECSVGVDGNRITHVAKEVERGEIEIDAAGCLVMPGCFNAHTHAAMTLLRGYAEGLPLREWLEKVWEVEARLDEDAVYWGTMLACVEMLKSGVTAFADMYIHMDAVAEAVGESGMRAVLGYGMADRGDEERARKELEIGLEFAEKWNGGFEGRVTTMLAPHAPYTCSPEFLKVVSDASKDKGFLKHIHVSETLWEVKEVRERYGKRPVEFLDSIGFLDSSTVLAHAVWLSEAEMKILAERGVSVAHCPTSNLKLSSGIAKVSELLEMGVNVGIGTDGAASNNMLSVLSDARVGALLQNLRGRSLKPGHWLEMATEGGYRAYNLKGGRIEEGYLADIVVFSKTCRNAPMHDPAAMLYVENQALHAVVDGVLVMEDGILVNVEEEKVIEKAEETALELVGG
ncbi:MAG: 5-methylthioadenosine/S-adenosylhomocysteine deaminase 2 [Archaeoglobus fulgidus]|uniref:5-methylthioadenosine/S-adenosylhomocysteine deaminase n=1 Tax=Archaeoglobus fulgidus TaxID=2234 RepID=A0A101DBL9_ARCFL|nr:amidohydrolase [Archaeoglobus fulgidus]KUJ92571.1 MAG: 5-methylthioadenosine/S-adenosylhomocysteine deaminase 2 [Archaeoglobus fulgidus]